MPHAYIDLLVEAWKSVLITRNQLGTEASLRVARNLDVAAHEATLERTAFVRFRKALVENGFDRSPFEEIVRQLDEHGVIVRTGTLVDATIIASASIRHDSEARWVGHRRKKPIHGYKAHVATDKEGIV